MASTEKDEGRCIEEEFLTNGKQTSPDVKDNGNIDYENEDIYYDIISNHGDTITITESDSIGNLDESRSNNKGEPHEWWQDDIPEDEHFVTPHGEASEKKMDRNQPSEKMDEKHQPIMKKGERNQPIMKKGERNQPIMKKGERNQPIMKKDERNQPSEKKNEGNQPSEKKDERNQPSEKKDERNQPTEKKQVETRQLEKKKQAKEEKEETEKSVENTGKNQTSVGSKGKSQQSSNKKETQPPEENITQSSGMKKVDAQPLEKKGEESRPSGEKKDKTQSSAEEEENTSSGHPSEKKELETKPSEEKNKSAPSNKKEEMTQPTDKQHEESSPSDVENEMTSESKPVNPSESSSSDKDEVNSTDNPQDILEYKPEDCEQLEGIEPVLKSQDDPLHVEDREEGELSPEHISVNDTEDTDYFKKLDAIYKSVKEQSLALNRGISDEKSMKHVEKQLHQLQEMLLTGPKKHKTPQKTSHSRQEDRKRRQSRQESDRRDTKRSRRLSSDTRDQRNHRSRKVSRNNAVSKSYRKDDHKNNSGHRKRSIGHSRDRDRAKDSERSKRRDHSHHSRRDEENRRSPRQSRRDQYLQSLESKMETPKKKSNPKEEEQRQKTLVKRQMTIITRHIDTALNDNDTPNYDKYSDRRRSENSRPLKNLDDMENFMDTLRDRKKVLGTSNHNGRDLLCSSYKAANIRNLVDAMTPITSVPETKSRGLHFGTKKQTKNSSWRDVLKSDASGTNTKTQSKTVSANKRPKDQATKETIKKIASTELEVDLMQEVLANIENVEAEHKAPEVSETPRAYQDKNLSNNQAVDKQNTDSKLSLKRKHVDVTDPIVFKEARRCSDRPINRNYEVSHQIVCSMDVDDPKRYASMPYSGKSDHVYTYEMVSTSRKNSKRRKKKVVILSSRALEPLSIPSNLFKLLCSNKLKQSVILKASKVKKTPDNVVFVKRSFRKRMNSEVSQPDNKEVSPQKNFDEENAGVSHTSLFFQERAIKEDKFLDRHKAKRKAKLMACVAVTPETVAKEARCLESLKQQKRNRKAGLSDYHEENDELSNPEGQIQSNAGNVSSTQNGPDESNPTVDNSTDTVTIDYDGIPYDPFDISYSSDDQSVQQPCLEKQENTVEPT